MTPHGKIIQNVVDLSLSVFVPGGTIQTGTAVIICSVRGFRSFALNSEGVEAANWLNRKGITAFVLKNLTLEMNKYLQNQRRSE